MDKLTESKADRDNRTDSGEQDDAPPWHERRRSRILNTQVSRALGEYVQE